MINGHIINGHGLPTKRVQIKVQNRTFYWGYMVNGKLSSLSSFLAMPAATDM